VKFRDDFIKIGAKNGENLQNLRSSDQKNWKKGLIYGKNKNSEYLNKSGGFFLELVKF